MWHIATQQTQHSDIMKINISTCLYVTSRYYNNSLLFEIKFQLYQIPHFDLKNEMYLTYLYYIHNYIHTYVHTYIQTYLLSTIDNEFIVI